MNDRHDRVPTANPRCMMPVSVETSAWAPASNAADSARESLFTMSW